MLSIESILEPLMFEFFGIKNFSNPIRFNSFIIFSIPLIVLSSPPNPTSPIDATRLGIGLSKKLEKIREFISIDTDARLLYWLLQGPRKAHWNNAELGSHIQFRRGPNIYERGLWYCFNFFYSGKYT